MSLVNRLVTLNLIDFETAIPHLQSDKREQILHSALDEMQSLLQEANEELIASKSKRVLLETNLVEILRNVQDLGKSDSASSDNVKQQLTALQEARKRLEEELNGLEIDEKQLHHETRQLEAKVSTAEQQKIHWLGGDRGKTKPAEPTATKAETKNNTAKNPDIKATPTNETVSGFDTHRVNEPFEQLERLKRKMEANEISTFQATEELDKQIRNAELEKLFLAEEEQLELAQQLGELKKKLK